MTMVSPIGCAGRQLIDAAAIRVDDCPGWRIGTPILTVRHSITIAIDATGPGDNGNAMRLQKEQARTHDRLSARARLHESYWRIFVPFAMVCTGTAFPSLTLRPVMAAP